MSTFDAPHLRDASSNTGADLGAPPRAVIGGDGRVNYGLFDQPIVDPRIESLGSRCRARTKRWHYVSLTMADHFIAIALADLGFAAHGFVYVVPKPLDKDDRRPAQETAILAMGQIFRPVLRMAPSSIEGSSRWRRRSERLEITWRPDARSVAGNGNVAGNGAGNGAGAWHLDIDWPIGGERLQGTVVVDRPATTRCLALVHPFGPINGADRPAYTHKAAGLAATADLRLGDEVIAGPGLATLDWTIGWMNRLARWKWASATWHTAAGERAGMNLGAGFYCDADGNGRESAVWLDGNIWPLGNLVFEVPAHPHTQPWRIRSATGDAVNLQFVPRGARHESVNLGVVVSEFIQPYGTFTGHIYVEGGPHLNLGGDTVVFGVVEDHVSRW